MRKTHNSSAECEIAAADFRNIAPSMVQGFPADNHKGSSVLRLPRKIGGNVLLLHPRGCPFRSPLYGKVALCDHRLIPSCFATVVSDPQNGNTCMGLRNRDSPGNLVKLGIYSRLPPRYSVTNRYSVCKTVVLTVLDSGGHLLHLRCIPSPWPCSGIPCGRPRPRYRQTVNMFFSLRFRRFPGVRPSTLVPRL